VSEWWTYRPSDFLMFSARNYARLVQGYNADAWPVPLLVLAGALALLWLAISRPALAGRWVPVALAAAWAWIAWAFHWERFAPINTGATVYAWAFGLQAALLLVLGGRRPHRTEAGWQRPAGLALAAAAVLLYPLASLLPGRDWAQAELAGWMPDPTALLTCGLLLATPQRHRGALLVLPVLALAAGWTTAGLLLSAG
jgi:hypothetical protein